MPQGKKIVWDEKINVYMALYMLFGVLWITAFLEYCSTFILLTSAASYYFDSDKDNEGSADVGYAF